MLGGVWARLVTGCVEEVQGIVMMLLLMVIMERAAQGTSLLYRCDSNSLRGETICRPRDKRNVEKPLAGQQTKEKKKNENTNLCVIFLFKVQPHSQLHHCNSPGSKSQHWSKSKESRWDLLAERRNIV